MKKKALDERSIKLPVDEAKQLLTIFRDSKTLRDLNGRRRHALDEATSCLEELLADGPTTSVAVPVTALRAMLLAAAATQAWIEQDWFNFNDGD